MRIFLDANILFSAAKSDGAVRRFLGMLADAAHVCCVDAYVVEEARRNLERLGVRDLAVLYGILERSERVASATPEQMKARGIALPTTLPEKDRPVLAAAVMGQCDALMTGDRRHFGLLYGKTVGGVTIHSPQSLATELLG